MFKILSVLLFTTLSAASIAAPASPRTSRDPLDLVDAARGQIGVTMTYDPAYQRLAYPNGDVPIERGVCTDVVVRAYRQLGVDLQVRVPPIRSPGTTGGIRTNPAAKVNRADHREVIRPVERSLGSLSAVSATAPDGS